MGRRNPSSATQFYIVLAGLTIQRSSHPRRPILLARSLENLPKPPRSPTPSFHTERNQVAPFRQSVWEVRETFQDGKDQAGV